MAKERVSDLNDCRSNLIVDIEKYQNYYFVYESRNDILESLFNVKLYFSSSTYRAPLEVCKVTFGWHSTKYCG